MGIYKRGDAYWVSVTDGGRRIRKSAGSGSSAKDAKKLEAQIRTDLANAKRGIKPRRLIAEALKQWLTNDCERLRSKKKFESHIRNLLPYVRGRYLDEAPTVATQYREANAHLSAATVNRRLAVLRRVCHLAYVEWEWIDAPIHERIRMRPENNSRHIYCTREHVDALAVACDVPGDTSIGDLVRLAAWTGLRRAELKRVATGASGVTIDGNLIILDADTKSRRPRMIPVPDHIVPIIERIPLPVSEWHWRQRWDKARRELNCEDLHWHDLRHTYASWLIQSGVSMRVAQELLGHSSITMTQRYSHLAPKHLVDAVTMMAKSQISHSSDNAVTLEAEEVVVTD